jgi:hypothetical protein
MVAKTGQPYAFTGDDPLNETDPLGLKGWYCVGGQSHYYQGNKYGAVGSGKCGSHSRKTGPAGLNQGDPVGRCSNGRGGPFSLAACQIVWATPGKITGSGGKSLDVNPNFDDPSVSPGPGFEWHGAADQAIGSEYGAWVNQGLGINLHPDMAHSGDVAPHYDIRIKSQGLSMRWYEGNWFQNQAENPLSVEELNGFLDLSANGGDPSGVRGGGEPVPCDPCEPP